MWFRSRRSASSAGEYIAIEKVEGVLLRSPFVEQIWAHGSHFESCLVAVVVPAKAKLEVSQPVVSCSASPINITRAIESYHHLSSLSNGRPVGVCPTACEAMTNPIAAAQQSDACCQQPSMLGPSAGIVHLVPGDCSLPRTCVLCPMQAWAKEQGVGGGIAELCEHPQAKRMLLKEVEDTGRKGGLKVRAAC